MQVIFFILGKKGYKVVTEFARKYGSSAIFTIVAAKDHNIVEDFHEEIFSFCQNNKISFLDRSNLPVHTFPPNIYKFAIGWRWMLNEPKLIVFHDSLLPRYRGFAPLVSALINGEKQLGVTALYASDKYDCGPIIFQKSVEINYPIKIKQAIDLVTDLYSHLVQKIYEIIINNEKLSTIEQIEEEATYSLWRDENDYFINWHNSAEKIKRFCDAVGHPYKGAKTYLNTKLVTIHEADVVPDVKIELRSDHIGKIIFIDRNCPIVVCGAGLLKIIKFEHEDKINSPKLQFRSRFS